MEQSKIFAETVADRYSCRAYSPAPVDDSQLSYILEQVRLAPSACNRQPWRIIVIRPGDEAGRNAVAASYEREWIRTAPYYIIMCGVPSEAWVRPADGHNHVDVDVSIATEHLCLAATALGLDTCWVCNFNPDVLSSGLGLDGSIVPVAIVPLGHPTEGTAAPAKRRKELGEILLER